MILNKSIPQKNVKSKVHVVHIGRCKLQLAFVVFILIVFR